MTPTRAVSGKDALQSPEQIVQALEEFLTAHACAMVVEEGRVLFDLRRAKYSLTIEHGRCTLQLWDEERNLVRRLSSVTPRGAGANASLRLTVHRFGQTRPGSLDILADRDRRTPSTQEAKKGASLKRSKTASRGALTVRSPENFI